MLLKQQLHNNIDVPVALHKENLQGCTHKKHKILRTGNSKIRSTHDPIFTHQSFSSFSPLAIVQLFGAPHPDDQSIEHINQLLGYGGSHVQNDKIIPWCP
jgi:hypothetical protein